MNYLGGATTAAGHQPTHQPNTGPCYLTSGNPANTAKKCRNLTGQEGNGALTALSADSGENGCRLCAPLPGVGGAVQRGRPSLGGALAAGGEVVVNFCERCLVAAPAVTPPAAANACRPPGVAADTACAGGPAAPKAHPWGCRCPGHFKTGLCRHASAVFCRVIKGDSNLQFLIPVILN